MVCCKATNTIFFSLVRSSVHAPLKKIYKNHVKVIQRWILFNPNLSQQSCFTLGNIAFNKDHKNFVLLALLLIIGIPAYPKLTDPSLFHCETWSNYQQQNRRLIILFCSLQAFLDLFFWVFQRNLPRASTFYLNLITTFFQNQLKRFNFLKILTILIILVPSLHAESLGTNSCWDRYYQPSFVLLRRFLLRTNLYSLLFLISWSQKAFRYQVFYSYKDVAFSYRMWLMTLQFPNFATKCSEWFTKVTKAQIRIRYINTLIKPRITI